MKSNRTNLTLGILAGAALAVFAVSKVGQNSVKKLGKRVAELRDSVSNEVREIKRLKGHGQRFI